MSTPAAVARSRARSTGRGVDRGTFLRFPLAVSLTELAAVFAISALVDLFDEGDVTLRFALVGVVLGLVGGLELRRVPRPSVTSAPAVMTMTTLSFVVLALGGALAHLVADATDDIDAALFEGMAPVTTTAMTGLDVDTLPQGLLMFRALLQWVGGMGALIVAMIVIPVVFGGKELAGRGQSERGGRAMLMGRTRGTRNIVGIYVGFTVLMLVGFAIAGMGLFDAVAHAMATVSTGGLSTRTGSLAAFDSAAVEWVAAVGMGLAGLNVGVVWWVLRGEKKALRRSSELRAYLLVMVLAGAALVAWASSGPDGGSALRTGVVAVTSAMSTTGFTATDWSLFDNGAQALLVVLIGVGAMSGSAGGGFRYVRVIQAFGFAARELQRQLHPSAIGVVRLNGSAVSERTLERMTAYIVVFIMIVAAGGMMIELGDSEVTPSAALSLSISVVSTAGPQVIDPVAIGDLGAVSKLSMATLMLLGRLSVYAVLLTVLNAGVRVREMGHRRS